MDASRDTYGITAQRRRWRPRFRVSTLFWLTALVAAFFGGRRSSEIESAARRWWQVTRVRFGAEMRKREHVVMWPPNSATINEDGPVQSISADNRKVCRVTLVSDRQIRITPANDGETVVRYSLPNLPKPCEFRVVVENKRIADWILTSPHRPEPAGE
jgi:hypothetical protein